MNLLKKAFTWLKYIITSNTLHGTHSPFVYKFLENVIYDRKDYIKYRAIEKQRKNYLSDATVIKIKDLGAGALLNDGKERKISSIAKGSLKSPKYGQLFFRMVQHFKPISIIELGTSLGISTSYFASADENIPVITMEGCPETLAFANKGFDKSGLKNITSIEGNFDHTFPELISKTEKLGMVYFDGNHRKQATLNYFEEALEKADENSIFIFDDIYWSDEMMEAWAIIKAHPKVIITVDLYAIGIVFFRKGQEKENFTIYY